jgi:hypothetical protein
MKKISIGAILAVAFVLFVIIAFTTPGAGPNEWISNLLSFATFIFAIILGFSIANRKQRMEQIRTRLRANDATILTLYSTAKAIGPATAKKTRDMLDEWLISQIDYNLVDFTYTTPQLIDIFEYVLSIKTPNGEDDEFKKKMVDDTRLLMQNQKAIIYWTKDKMQSFEWLSILVLGATIIFCMFFLRNNTLVSNIFTPIIASTIVLLGLVLKEIDALEWQEHNWVWWPLCDLFIEMGLPPYFPEDIFSSGRVNKRILKSIPKYRIAHYKFPYPRFEGKEVELVKK